MLKTYSFRILGTTQKMILSKFLYFNDLQGFQLPITGIIGSKDNN